MYNMMQETIVDGGRDSTTHFPLYFWYKKVPALNPLSSEFPDANALLEKMKSFTKDDQGNQLDRYSFLDDGTAVGEIQGTAGDIGMDVRYVQDNTGKIFLIVISSDKNSPTDKAGIDRGWIITSINGKSADWDNGGPNYTRAVNAIYYDAQATFGFKKPDGSASTITLAKAEYKLNPVLFDTVYNISGKNVGYFVFNSFADVMNNGVATITKNEIDRVFNSFSSKNITSLIVDLRYNGGGEVRTVQYLCNKIAPLSTNGKLMSEDFYNDLLGPELKAEEVETKLFFNGTGNLALQNVFFIGTRSTASASELTYNNLRPYMDVKLVGDTTFGKPVGMWVQPITIEKNKVKTFLAYLFAITFESRNANNEGDYYNGFAPDAPAKDFVNVPWGNPGDDNLIKIFNYISTGSYGRMSSAERMQKDPSLKQTIPVKFPSLRFDGMVRQIDLKELK